MITMTQTEYANVIKAAFEADDADYRGNILKNPLRVEICKRKNGKRIALFQIGVGDSSAFKREDGAAFATVNRVMAGVPVVEVTADAPALPRYQIRRCLECDSPLSVTGVCTHCAGC